MLEVSFMTPHAPCRRRALRSERGFTLIELIVTVSVLAMVLTVAAPSFTSFVAGQKVKSASNDLTTALILARSEAIKRNADIVITPVVTDTWASGWSVTAGGTTLLQQEALPGVSLTKTPSTITYKSSGRPTATSRFEIAGASTVTCLNVDTSGIPSTKRAACP